MDATANSAWRVGEVIENLYEVRQVIESSGMGLVHRVHHRGWNMDLAVKTPRPELITSPQQIADFESEAQTWVELGLHPHVVACVYVRRLGGLPRVFAEWVDGGSLADAIESRRLYEGGSRQVLPRILDVAIQFAWGLDYAHSRGLVHQDVKPLNVMLTADWTAKVTDFGPTKARAVAAEKAAEAPGVSVLAGYAGMTAAYCSPEQAQAAHTAKTGGRPAPLTRATDAWSWAISVWEMFTGETSVGRGQAAAEAFAAFREDSWVEDAAIPAMPDTLAQLLTRCLDPDPVTRARRMGELADELAQLYHLLTGVPYPRPKSEPAKLLADGLNNQALSMLDIGRADQAERLWQQALATDPHHPQGVYNFGLHRWRAALITDVQLIAELQAMRARHPDDPLCGYLLGSVHLERGDVNAARELLEPPAERAPLDPDIAAALNESRSSRSATVEPVGALAAHNGWVVSVQLSADGSTAVSCGEDGAARVWDLSTGEGRILATNERPTVSHASTHPCAAVNADGSVKVVGLRDGTVRLFRDKSLTAHTLTCHSAELPDRRARAAAAVGCVSVSLDGRLGISGGSDQTVRVWDLQRAHCVHTLTGHTGTIMSVLFSVDHRLAFSASGDNTVRVWAVGTGRCLHTLTGHTDAVAAVAVSAAGKLAVTAGFDGTVRVWDTDTGQCLHTLSGHSGRVTSVALSPDGLVAVSGGWDDKLLRVWSVAQGRCVGTLSGHEQDITSVAITGDGRFALSASWDATVRLWELSTGRCLHTLTAHQARISSMVLTPDGRTAASSSFDHTVRVWHLAAELGSDSRWIGRWSYVRPQSSQTLVDNAALVRAAVETVDGLISDGQFAAAADKLRAAREVPGHRHDPQLVDRWRQVTRIGRHSAHSAARQLHVLEHRGLTSVALSADGRIAVSGGEDEMVRVWEVATGRCLHVLTDHAGLPVPMHDHVFAVAISADGQVAVSGGENGARVWDTASGRCLRTLHALTPFLGSIALSADGRVALTGRSGDARLWDVGTGQLLHAFGGQSGKLTSSALTPDGRLAVCGSQSDAVGVWDARNGSQLGYWTDRFGGRSLAVSADGLTAVSCGWQNGIQIWELSTGRCLQTLAEAAGQQTSVVMGADGRLIVSGGTDSTLRVWEVGSGRLLHTLRGHTRTTGLFSGAWVAVSADVDVVVSGSGDNTIRVWELEWDYEFGAGESAAEAATVSVADLPFGLVTRDQIRRRSRGELRSSETVADLPFGLVTSDQIRRRSRGEVRSSETVDLRRRPADGTFAAVPGGLFCEEIFGPLQPWQCGCGTNLGFEVCPACRVREPAARMRRRGLGHIELAVPVLHLWCYRRPWRPDFGSDMSGESSAVALLIDMPQNDLEAVVDYAAAVIASVDAVRREADLSRLTAEMAAERQRVVDLRDSHEPARLDELWHTFLGLDEKQLIRDPDLFDELVMRYGAYFSGGWGAQAIQTILAAVDPGAAVESVGMAPPAVVLDAVPVATPQLRGMAYRDDKKVLKSDLAYLYEKLLIHNTRSKRLKDLVAPLPILRNEQRMLQRTVDALLDNAHIPDPLTIEDRRLRSLSDLVGGQRDPFGQLLAVHPEG